MSPLRRSSDPSQKLMPVSAPARMQMTPEMRCDARLRHPPRHSPESMSKNSIAVLTEDSWIAHITVVPPALLANTS
ncbi:hypothetical protein EVAR_63141_1 [Eumeta japonica]|uniref:Uncharacterized protein n=1 Tax=Eumeta variegata TaxID=151549 RepID=A0A4C1SQD1_EUMVA|nr:hypothetical protein EVAR_63141_1 [Eumeta japonica]